MNMLLVIPVLLAIPFIMSQDLVQLAVELVLLLRTLSKWHVSNYLLSNHSNTWFFSSNRLLFLASTFNFFFPLRSFCSCSVILTSMWILRAIELHYSFLDCSKPATYYNMWIRLHCLHTGMDTFWILLSLVPTRIFWATLLFFNLDFLTTLIAVQCRQNFFKQPREMKRIVYRKLRSIDMTSFCSDLENSPLLTDSASEISALVDQYNNITLVTLCSMDCLVIALCPFNFPRIVWLAFSLKILFFFIVRIWSDPRE